MGVSELNQERKALDVTSKRFSAAVSKLSVLVGRTTWKGQAMLPFHKLRVENMATVRLANLFAFRGAIHCFSFRYWQNLCCR